jgi:hypothetical protein
MTQKGGVGSQYGLPVSVVEEKMNVLGKKANRPVRSCSSNSVLDGLYCVRKRTCTQQGADAANVILLQASSSVLQLACWLFVNMLEQHVWDLQRHVQFT